MGIYLTSGTLYADDSTQSNSAPMRALSFSELQTLWVNNGGDPRDAATMAKVAQLESGGVPNIVNNADNWRDRSGVLHKQSSWGLWQLSNGNNTAPGMNWANADANAAAAVQKFKTQGPQNAWPNTYPAALGTNAGARPGSTTSPWQEVSNLVNEGEQFIVGGIETVGKDILQAAEGGANFLLAPLKFTAGAIAAASNVLENFGPFIVGLLLLLIGGLMLAQAHRDDANKSKAKQADALSDLADTAKKIIPVIAEAAAATAVVA